MLDINLFSLAYLPPSLSALNSAGSDPRAGGKIGPKSAEAEKSLFYQVKTSTSHKLTDRYLCFSLRDILALESGRSDRVAMKRSINFGSIFRRKEDQQPPPAGDQTNQAVLLERLAGRSIKLAEGDLSPVSSASPSVDWDTVGGQITILATAIEGILEGRTRIRAQHLKNLSPSPIDAGASPIC